MKTFPIALVALLSASVCFARHGHGHSFNRNGATYYTGATTVEVVEVNVDYSQDLYKQILDLYNSRSEINEDLAPRLPKAKGGKVARRLYFVKAQTVSVPNRYDPEVRRKVASGEYQEDGVSIVEQKVKTLGLKPCTDPFVAVAYVRDDKHDPYFWVDLDLRKTPKQLTFKEQVSLLFSKEKPVEFNFVELSGRKSDGAVSFEIRERISGVMPNPSCSFAWTD